MIMCVATVATMTPTRKGRTMTQNDAKLEWEVVKGFGDYKDSPDTCFSVEKVATFANETDAGVFADLYYETNIQGIQENMGDWWKSFFVIARRRAANVTPDEVAARFDSILREWMTAGEYAEMLRLNRTEEYRDSCASHNFCDSNVAMLEALESFGYSTDKVGTGDETLALWNAAWKAWRASK